MNFTPALQVGVVWDKRMMIYMSWHIYIVARLLKLQVLMLSTDRKQPYMPYFHLDLHRTIPSHVVFDYNHVVILYRRLIIQTTLLVYRRECHCSLQVDVHAGTLMKFMHSDSYHICLELEE